jgi:hypothetical protein
MRTPQLALLQAMLIYLQRPNGLTVTAAADKSGDWAMLGSAIHVAYQLGLHLECQNWPIPGWERRLRRRLWWVTHSEATWRSLLLGLPHPIPTDQWDVSALEEDDFVIDNLQCPTEESSTREPALQDPCPFCHAGYDFLFMSTLSLHAYDVYRELYTLAATRRYAGDFDGSVATGQRLLTRLREWRANLPPHMTLESVAGTQGKRQYYHPGSATHVKLAHLTLEVLIYRAMLRPLPATFTASGGESDNVRSSLRGYARCCQHSQEPQHQHEDFASIVGTFRGAIAAAQCASSFAHRLGSYDRNSLYYSCKYLLRISSRIFLVSAK